MYQPSTTYILVLCPAIPSAPHNPLQLTSLLISTSKLAILHIHLHPNAFLLHDIQTNPLRTRYLVISKLSIEPSTRLLYQDCGHSVLSTRPQCIQIWSWIFQMPFRYVNLKVIQSQSVFCTTLDQILKIACSHKTSLSQIFPTNIGYSQHHSSKHGWSTRTHCKTRQRSWG